MIITVVVSGTLAIQEKTFGKPIGKSLLCNAFMIIYIYGVNYLHYMGCGDIYIL